MADDVLSAKQVASMLDTDARTFRKFMREVTDPDDHPGQGGRWNFVDDEEEIGELSKKFAEWQGSKTKRVRLRSTEDEVDDDDVEELEDEVEEFELDDEDIEEI